MTAGIRKRHEQRAGFDAWLVRWRALDAAKSCRACHDAGTIRHEEGELPCPLCDPAGAREAAEGTKP